jgi:hypothetical protein
MADALIECLHAEPETALKTGSKLLDLSVDLSSAFPQDCPPISFFRVVMRENVFLRDLRFARGEHCKVGEVVAVFSTDPNEDKNQVAQRGIRFATAGIIHHAAMWTGSVA